MGEYAMHQGKQIKIGTCEEMFVLPSILQDCTKLEHSMDPHGKEELQEVRFPLPEGVIGCKGDASSHPAMVKLLDEQGDHGNVWLGNQGNYIRMAIPCSVSRASGLIEGTKIRVHRDDTWPVTNRNSYHVTGFAIRQGKRALILRCTTCGRPFNIPTSCTEFLDAVDLLNGDLTLIENEWRILERMCGLPTRDLVKPESEVLPEGTNIVPFPA